jgi:hypothetical protein
MKKIFIEIQHFNGCPNSTLLIERIRKALTGLDYIDYKEVIVDSNEKAKAVKFRGSPTLLINGKDFEDQTASDEPALSCRYYINVYQRLLK